MTQEELIRINEREEYIKKNIRMFQSLLEQIDSKNDSKIDMMVRYITYKRDYELRKEFENYYAHFKK